MKWSDLIPFLIVLTVDFEPFSSLNDVAVSNELIENLSNQKVFVLKGGFRRILNEYAFNGRTAQKFENWDESNYQNEGEYLW